MARIWFPALYGSAQAISQMTLQPESFGAVGDGVADDTEALRRTLDGCIDKTTDVCTVHLKRTYLTGPLRLNASGIDLIIDGTLRLLPRHLYPRSDVDRATWGAFMTSAVGVENLTIRGTGVVDGQGSGWWRGQLARFDHQWRPHLMVFSKAKDLRIGPLRLQDPPNHFIQCIDCNGFRVDGLEATASSTSPNTDGINFYGGNDQSIRNSVIRNGDDCISVVPSGDPSSYQCQARPETCVGGNMLAENVTCDHGHGISIGSVRHGTVKNATFRNITLTGGITQGKYSTGGARIKSYPNGTGKVYDVLYEDIIMDGPKFPLQIQGRYCPGGPKTCPPGPTAVEVSNITFRRVRGHGGARMVADFDCDPEAPCSGIIMEDVHLQGPWWNPLPSYVRCASAAGSINNVDPSSASCLQTSELAV